MGIRVGKELSETVGFVREGADLVQEGVEILRLVPEVRVREVEGRPYRLLLLVSI